MATASIGGSGSTDELINCPHCQQSVCLANYAERADIHVLWCDQCANRVEVNYYDLVYHALYQELVAHQTIDYFTLMAAIEPRLRPCNCGGHFRHDAARRCPHCLAKIVAEPGPDVFPLFYYVADEDDDPTAEQEEAVSAYEQIHVRREDIWGAV
jgi:hypothetical protein